MRKYAHREDCFIERDDKNYPASAVLYDCEGEMLFRFDEDWTDDQIFAALDFANKLYEKGIQMGEYSKIREIKKSLNID